MTLPAELRARVAVDAEPANDADILWYHPAFCQSALPAEPGASAPWQRTMDGVAVSIEPGSERDRLPGGPWLRLLLMHLCDSAARSGHTQVALGEDAEALALAIDASLAGVATAGLEAQVGAVLSCRIFVARDGGQGLSVLDARGRPRAVAAEWRSAVRLNGRFLETLTREKVPLDRGVAAKLHHSALALDIYAWLCLLLPHQQGQVMAESWTDLQLRFGTPGQDSEAFQAACPAALALLRAACPGLEVEEDAIGVGFSARAPQPSAMPEPAPMPEMRPEPPVVVTPPPPPAPVPPAPVPPAPVVEPAATEPPPMRQPRAPDRPGYGDAPPQHPSAQQQPAYQRVAAQHEPQERGGPMRQTISLKSHLTGLQQVVWLQRANGRDNVLIEVTPGSRYDPALVTVLALEPIVLQIVGGLHARDFERASAWATANRDLIDAFWDGLVDNFDEIISRVRKVPAPGWR